MSAENNLVQGRSEIVVADNDVIQMLCRQISDMAVKIAVLEAFIQKGGGRNGHDPVPN